MSVPLLRQFDLGHVVETEVDKILQKLFSHMGLDGLTTASRQIKLHDLSHEVMSSYSGYLCIFCSQNKE